MTSFVSKSIYFFEYKKADGNSEMKDLLGSKGANLAQMCKIGINVPPGFTITTKECNNYFIEKKLNLKLKTAIINAIKTTEKSVNRIFGDDKQFPLLFSVRSGAKYSMPGMMDTILNLGLNDKNVITLEKMTNNKRFALDSYRRLIQMYSNVVLEINHSKFENILNQFKEKNNIETDSELTAENLEILIMKYKKLVKNETMSNFPQDPFEQLFRAIEAVFKSWMNSRAIKYRQINNISHAFGTAVTIQSMVFGNLNDNSGTGVVFSRNPSTGVNEIYGEYLLNAQGEDVVAGIRTPLPIKQEIDAIHAKVKKINTKNKTNENNSHNVDNISLEQSMPKIYKELVSTARKLEKHCKDVQDIEFTIENEKLWILQTRNAKRTALASIKIAYDLVEEKVINKKNALKTIDPKSLNQLLHKRIDPECKKKIIAQGLPASPGSASGMIVFDAKMAEKLTKENKKVILVRNETSPEDISGMYVAEGILTKSGGMTSHAAIIARGFGKPCVCGCALLNIDYEKKILKIDKLILKENDIITIDGSTGDIIMGNVKMIDVNLSSEFKEIMRWAQNNKKIDVRANAETVIDCKKAIEFGADGIGLCRTEHMFFNEHRILQFRKMIIANTLDEREKALQKILIEQKYDFIKIFETMNGLPVNIRLLDPPLHEFLPSTEEDINNFAIEINKKVVDIKKKIAELSEVNPMLGHRGCRLGITYPEIYKMQVNAIFEAFVYIKQKKNINIKLEIMIPLVIDVEELKILKELILKIKLEIEQRENIKIPCQIGTMIELPRACLMADKISEYADFFSFGTNDLTQSTLGLSRDDSVKFMKEYINQKIFTNDPFETLDDGVKELIKIAMIRSKKKKKNMKFGICGEHGGDPESIDFCCRVGMNYISCSPYKIPITKLTVALFEINKGLFF